VRVLIDTDILLDVALEREPFVRDSRPVLVRFVEVTPTGTEEAQQALGFPMPDFEDALQAAAALAFDALFFVTRNTKDYKGSPVPAISPARFLKELGR